MSFWKKKQTDETEMPPMPEGEELPPLPPLPGEDELEIPGEEPVPAPRMRPAAPMMPRPTMAPSPQTSWMPQMPAEKPTATVFVKLDKYRDIMRTVSDIDNKLIELQATLDRIAAIKTREGEIVDGWAAMLNDAKSKIDEVNSKLTKPEN
jgi:hypothetical protein